MRKCWLKTLWENEKILVTKSFQCLQKLFFWVIKSREFVLQVSIFPLSYKLQLLDRFDSEPSIRRQNNLRLIQPECIG